MKKYLIISLYLLINASFAGHIIDFTEEKVMCGNYMLSDNSNREDILKNCKIIEMEKKRHFFHKELELKFIATIKESEIIECEFNKKNNIKHCKVE